MAHLAQHPAIGRHDAFHSPDGTVGVYVHVHAGDTVLVHILSDDLAVVSQLPNQLLTAQEPALAVGDGDGVNVAHLRPCQPRRAVGSDAGPHQTGLVAADGVEGQGGAGLVGVDDLTVGDKTQLDERLETVADAQHQAVPVFQQVHGGVPHLRVAEKGGNEFGGAVRLIAAGEAAGDENDLAVPGCLGETAD